MIAIVRHLIIIQVDVVAKETYNTEEHELFYIEDLNKFFDEKSEITKHEFDSAQEYYLSQGFSKSQKFAGANKLSFIKDGKSLLLDIGKIMKNMYLIVLVNVNKIIANLKLNQLIMMM